LTNVLIERPAAHVVLLRLNRPEARNALSPELREELREHFLALSIDPDCRAIVVTGDRRAFAAGADIKAMAEADPAGMMARGDEANWAAISQCPRPIVAAVNGYALGGGCELAMTADIIVAGRGATFGQPEVKLGIMPGAGGTQRLARAIGKAKTMELCLTGRMMDAAEAERAGLVARVVPAAELLADALKTAETIASQSLTAVMMAKDCVNRAFETTLAEGIRYERRTFHAMFATHDQKEGMAAFIEKRKPAFKNG
jgi:enoyl-CoA hydratase